MFVGALWIAKPLKDIEIINSTFQENKATVRSLTEGRGGDYISIPGP